MNRNYRLQFCKQCENQKFTSEKGIICSLTNEYAQFDKTCEDYIENPAEKERIENQKNQMLENEIEEESLGLSFIGVKNGVIAGQIAIFGAILWLILGITYLDRIFLYPFALMVIGGIAWNKGLKRKKEQEK